MSVQKENWRPVVGFEGAYEVSDFGRVRSLDRLIEYDSFRKNIGRSVYVAYWKKGRVLRPGVQKKSGHLTVALCGHSKLVHVLVLEAFIGQRPNRMEGCHFNDDPSDNRLENLRWGTRSDNLNDAVRNGKKPVGDAHYVSKLKSTDINFIRRECRKGRGSVVRLARMFGVTEVTIRQVRDGISWKSVREGAACA